MQAPDSLHRWRPLKPVARVLKEAPSEAISPKERVTPLRKREGFVPAVQRWSHQLPPGETQFRIAFFGAEAPLIEALNGHPLFAWVRKHLLAHPAGPTVVDHARSRS